MHKSKAIELLGGTPTAAAAAMNISASAVSQWPEWLHEALKVRVLAALARKHLPSEILDHVDLPEANGASRPASAGQTWPGGCVSPAR